MKYFEYEGREYKTIEDFETEDMEFTKSKEELDDFDNSVAEYLYSSLEEIAQKNDLDWEETKEWFMENEAIIKLIGRVMTYNSEALELLEWDDDEDYCDLDKNVKYGSLILHDPILADDYIAVEYRYTPYNGYDFYVFKAIKVEPYEITITRYKRVSK